MEGHVPSQCPSVPWVLGSDLLHCVGQTWYAWREYMLLGSSHAQTWVLCWLLSVSLALLPTEVLGSCWVSVGFPALRPSGRNKQAKVCTMAHLKCNSLKTQWASIIRVGIDHDDEGRSSVQSIGFGWAMVWMVTAEDCSQWNRVLLQKPIVTQLIKKWPAFCGKWHMVPIWDLHWS